MLLLQKLRRARWRAACDISACRSGFEIISSSLGRHGLHVARLNQIAFNTITNDFRHAADARADRGHSRRHPFERRETKRFDVARQQKNVAARSRSWT